ncbi:hypothetical protein ACQP3J_33065, partial [Escherichia coli]
MGKEGKITLNVKVEARAHKLRGARDSNYGFLCVLDTSTLHFLEKDMRWVSILAALKPVPSFQPIFIHRHHPGDEGIY